MVLQGSGISLALLGGASNDATTKGLTGSLIC